MIFVVKEYLYLHPRQQLQQSPSSKSFHHSYTFPNPAISNPSWQEFTIFHHILLHLIFLNGNIYNTAPNFESESGLRFLPNRKSAVACSRMTPEEFPGAWWYSARGTPEVSRWPVSAEETGNSSLLRFVRWNGPVTARFVALGAVVIVVVWVSKKKRWLLLCKRREFF